MNAKLLFALASIVCLAAPGFTADSLWIVGGGGGTGDLVSVEVWLEYTGGGAGDSISAFDIPLTFDASICTVEAITIGADFSAWTNQSKADNAGTDGPPAQPKMGLSAFTFGPPIGPPFVEPGVHHAATVDFRIVGTPGTCTDIDTLAQAFSPPIFLGYVDKAGIVTYSPGFMGDQVCALRAISWTVDPDFCGGEYPEGTAFASTVTATDNGGQAVTITQIGGPGSFDGNNPGSYTWGTGPGDVGQYDIVFEGITTDQFVDTFTCHVDIIAAAPYKLEFKKVLAWPGQQHVLVPVWITAKTPIAPDPVGGFEVLVSFDPTAVSIVDVVSHDFMITEAIDCDGIHHYDVPSLFHKPGFYPEYFDYTIGAGGHFNWVKVTGIMDMEWPQEHVPPIDTGQMPLFALVVDLNPMWEGMEAYFHFEFTGCGDNILSDPTGYIIYGPTEDDAPAWLDCPYNPAIVLRDGADGCPGIGIRSVTIGDINLNGIKYEVGDAIVFVNYLMYGNAALVNGREEEQKKASDLNGDGFFWTIADLVMLLNLINEVGPTATPPGESVELTISGADVELASNVDVGAVYFVMKYEGDIAAPELHVDGMDLAWNVENGLLKVLVYSLESNPIAAGTHTLFTVPGAKNLTVDKVDIADAGGTQLGVRISVAPKSFVLYQNRPNPVRSTTEIAYAIPTDSKVSLKVYDAAGMLVETLINEWKPRGFYSATWDANEIASGVYFYKLEAGEHSATGKLIRMR